MASSPKSPKSPKSAPKSPPKSPPKTSRHSKQPSQSSQRDPPPSLFLGPSQNASHVSLPGILSSPVPPVNPPGRTLTRERSARMAVPAQSDIAEQGESSPALPTTSNGPSAAGNYLRPVTASRQQRTESQKQTDRTDALWAEMQSTLEEVELSAVNGKHVFGPNHAESLEGLRQAQIALAQAWARSEADDAVEVADKESKGVKGAGISEGKSAVSGSEGKQEAGKSTAQGGSQRPGSSSVGAEGKGTRLEEETEADILLARKRREANDRYFHRVNEGVLDVVAKLEEVAIAMRAVEQESRDIWGENESIIESVAT